MSNIDFRLLKQLWMFKAVAEELHFGNAAKKLGMSQPPLTEQIKQLEQTLKLQLFSRSRQGTTLTPAGKAILPSVKKFIAQAEHLEYILEEVASGQTGVVNIGAITAAMLDVVPELMAYFEKNHPRSTIFVHEIDSYEAIPLLESGEIDLAFVRLDDSSVKGIATLPLSDDMLAVALPCDHPLAGQQKVSIKSLSAENHIMSSRQVSPVYFDIITGICRDNGFSPRIMHQVRSVTSQIAYVSCGQGISLVPYSMKKLAPKNVVVRQIKEKIKIVVNTLAWNPERYNPIVNEAVTWIRNNRK